MAKRLTITLHIQSFSDIITNSSSETFVITGENNISKTIVFRELLSVKENSIKWHEKFERWDEFIKNTTFEERFEKYIGSSGDGGEINIQDWKDTYEEWVNGWIPDNKRDRITPEIWALTYKKELPELKKELTITIDEDLFTVIKYVLDNYFITEEDCWQNFLAEKDPSTGRILRRVDQTTYETLPEDRKAFYDYYKNF